MIKLDVKELPKLTEYFPKIKLFAASVAVFCGIAIMNPSVGQSPLYFQNGYAIENTGTDATATDAAFADSEETTQETAAQPLPSQETAIAQETTAQETGDLSLIPLSQLNIADDDISTENEVRNRTQTNYVPALSSPLGQIHEAGTDITLNPGFLCGIDVSKHQGTINWTKVKNDGIQFAFIKVAGRGYETGQLYYDKKYKENLSGASAAGIKTGAYFFSQATSVQEAREEASMLIDALKGYHITYPVVFDWETAPGYRTYSGLSKSTMTAMAETFCDMVEAAGYKAMVYANTFDFERFQASTITTKYDAWLARYPANYSGNQKRFTVGDGIPSLDYPYQIWQYSDSGHVDGISENVDMNVAFIDYSGSATAVPMRFDMPAESYHTALGQEIDVLSGIKVFNCAGINATASMKLNVTDKNGTGVNLSSAIKTAGKYTLTYSLKDFTGYTGYKTLELSVQTPPVIHLNQTVISLPADALKETAEEMIQNNLSAAYDFTGNDLTNKVTIIYPSRYYEEIIQSPDLDSSDNQKPDVPEPSTPLSENSSDAAETTGVDTDSETTSFEETTPDSDTETTTEPESETISAVPVIRLIPGSYTITYQVTDSYGLQTALTCSLIIVAGEN